MTKNFTENPAATTLTGTEIVPAIQAGVDVKATVAALVAMAQARAGHTGTQAQSTIIGLVADLASKAADTAVVKLTGNQTVAGVKTFSAAPVVPDGSWSISDTAGLQDALDAVPVDGSVVHDTGDETVAGIKTFTSAPVVPDGSWAIADTSGLQPALDAKAADSAVVKLAGNQTVAGTKTFSSPPVVPDPTASTHAASRGYVIRSVGVDVGAPGGVDDTALFNAAKAAAGVGGTVVFSAGTYVLSGAAASVADQHIVVRPGATIKTKDAANTPTIDVTANGVTIDGGGTINGNRAGQSDATTGLTSCVRIVSRTGVTVQGLILRDSLSHAVYVDASTSVTIDGNTISGCAPAGNQKQVLVYDLIGSSSDVWITNNRIDSSAILNGCIAVTTSAAARTLRRIRITGNYCKLGDSNATDTLGIELFTSGTATVSDFTVEGNIVEGATGVVATDHVYGISIGGTSASVGYGVIDGTVAGNVVRNCPFASIEVVGTAVACTGNTCIGSGPLSVSAVSTTGGLFGVTVTGNTLLDSVSTAYAIHLNGGANGLFGCVVSANTVRNSAAAAAIYSEGVVFGASITGNTVTDAAGVAMDLLGTFTDSVVANNVFDLTGVGSTVDGILIGATTVARVSITGNVIKGAGRNGIYGLVSTSDIDVKDNRITHCDNGLKADAAETRWTVVGNTISNNTDRGLIFAVASTDLAIASNSIHDNPGGNYYTTGSTFLTHVINGAGG